MSGSQPLARRTYPAVLSLFSVFLLGVSAVVSAEPIFEMDPKAREEVWDITAPRGNVREIDFYTEEGTWMSVDVSPDGKSLVFDLLGHIYLLPIEGGEAVCLTQGSGIAVNYHPRFSRDGTRIAYISDRAGQNNVWIMNADGTNPQLVHDDLVGRYAEPEWSADQQSIYATRFEPNARGGWSKAAEIWRLTVDGSKQRKLIGGPSMQAWTPKASADGEYLYYHFGSEPIVSADGYYKISDYHHIRRMDLSTERTEHVTQPEYRRYHRILPFYTAAPEISPDGQRLAFTRKLPNAKTRYREATVDTQTGLVIRDLETGLDDLVAAPMTPAQFETHSMYHLKTSPGYAWLPDGSGVVFSQGGALRHLDLASKQIRTIPFRARVRRTMSEMVIPNEKIRDDALKIRNPRWPTLSPDGARLAFEAIGRIWIKDLADGNIRELVPTDEAVTQLSPSWSPDGTRLAYASWSEMRGGEVLVINAEGGVPRRVAQSPKAYLNPTWTPSGDALVVLRGAGAMARGRNFDDNGWHDLMRIPLSGGDPQHISVVELQPRILGQFAIPRVQRDGSIQFVAPSTEDDGSTSLFSVKQQGAQPQALLTLNGLVGDAQFSPDGQYVAYHYAHNIFVAPRKTGRGTPSQLVVDSPIARARQVSSPHGRYPHWGEDGDLHFFTLDQYATCAPPFKACRYEPLGLSVRPDRGAGVIALKNASILTNADAGFIKRGSILIENGRITCVGKCDLKNANEIIDLKGKYITPGLVSIHDHDTVDGPDVFRARFPNFAKWLAYGVTTVMDPAGANNVTLLQREFLEAGHMIGPRIATTSRPLYSWDPARHEIYDQEDATQNVDRLAGQGARGIKQYFILNRYQRQWITTAARRHGDLLMTGEMMDIHYFLGAIMDGHTALEHEATYWPYYEDYKSFLEQSGTYLSLTTVTPARGRYLMEYFMSGASIPEDVRERNFAHPHVAFRQRDANQLDLSAYEIAIFLQDAKDLKDRGVVHGGGGHGEVPGLSQHWELWSFALHSSADDAWKAMTINSARYLGLDGDIGSIEVGKLADLVVLDKHPLKDIRNSTSTVYVMKGGRLYNSDTLEQIWPEKVPFGPTPWAFREEEGGVRDLSELEYIN